MKTKTINNIKLTLLVPFLLLSLKIYSQAKFTLEYDFRNNRFIWLKYNSTQKNYIELEEDPFIPIGEEVDIRISNINPLFFQSNISVKESNSNNSNSKQPIVQNIKSILNPLKSLNLSTFTQNITGMNSKGARSNMLLKEIKEYNVISDLNKKTYINLNSNVNNIYKSKKDIINAFIEDIKQYKHFLISDKINRNNLSLSLFDLKRILSYHKNTIIGIQKNNSSSMDYDTSTFKLAIDDIEENERIIENISQLISKVSSIHENNVYTTVINNNSMIVDIEIIPNQNNNINNNEKENTKINNFSKKIKTKEFIIDTGIAITFNSYGDKSKSFFVARNNSTINFDVNKSFTPNLATTIRFRFSNSNTIHIGGNFGISIPINGSFSDVSFLFGPSISYGKKQNITLLGGVSVGPVYQLSNGLQVGDKVDFFDLSPYLNKTYALGAFFGISFDLFKLN
ncbi:hypothetical protein TSEDIMI_40005 [Tenacibaculum sediminilitoris]|uniref:hypothetical protein n=1 Tax=Tenacibaculum sediminilitoris TaxID=1820334 RepID=UPI0038942EEF